MSFSLIFNIFQVSNPSFLGFCVYVEIWKYGCWIWFCWFCYNACYTYFTCLFFILMHRTMLCVVLCISCFFDFETSNDYMFLHFSLGAHFCIWCAHTHTHTHIFFDMLSVQCHDSIMFWCFISSHVICFLNYALNSVLGF